MGERSDTRLTQVSFTDIEGWSGDDHAAALAAFARGASAVASPPLARLMKQATALAAGADDAVGRAFFEDAFDALAAGTGGSAGFFTGYYEPEVDGSLTETPVYRFPLHRRPPDLVEIAPGSVSGLDPALTFARRADGGMAEHPDRGAIAAGALDGRGLELVWLTDPADAFFIHIQGSAAIRLPDGSRLRVGYDGKTGHPYTAIGRVLVDMGALSHDAASMQDIRDWLAAHPVEGHAVMARNRSYVFFRRMPAGDDDPGPRGAAGVALTPGRSLAVDHGLHPYHSPVWIDTTLPDGTPYRRLMIAHDTGSAIVGQARGDIFFGSGEAAGEIAGRMRASGRFIVLTPKAAP